ncbi:DUF397 domain-containing protein [Streptomyces albidoflavus]
MQNGTDLYALDIHGARIGEGAWALGDSKRPDAKPLRFTTEELGAAGIDPARFGLGA